MLGGTVPLDLPFDEQYWLETTVGNDAALTPRTALTASPYSLSPGPVGADGADRPAGPEGTTGPPGPANPAHIDVQTDNIPRNFGTAWGQGAVFTTVPGFKAGSSVRITYYVPMRNDSGDLGGGFVEPQISFNGGTTWNSLGSSGFAAVMNVGAAIGAYTNTLLVDPNMSSDYTVTIRFYHKSRDGTLQVNQASQDINFTSGTAAVMSGVNGQQHFTKVIVEEIY